MSAARSAASAAAAGVEPQLETQAADSELRAWLEECLGHRVDALARRPLAEATSFACERLTVTAAGRTLELFLKDYDRCRLPRPDRDGARREVLVYRHLLDGARLGTAEHLGSRLPEEGRSWLLLESVPGSRLSESGWWRWLDAAAWLGRLQAHGAERGLVSDGPVWLVRHDLAELRATAEEAVREVAAVDLSLERALQDALEGYESLVEILAAQPPALVHGSFRPENILVDVPGAPARVVPVDWEHAALGCALYDVSVLSAGLERGQVEQLLAAQRASAAAHGLRLPAGDAAWELVTLLRLHKLLRSLGRARRWNFERGAIERSIAQAVRLRHELQSSRGHRARSAAALPHPAVRSWKAAGGDDAITGISRLRGRFFGRKGRVVYRLSGADGDSIVAKRSSHATLALEHHLYSQVLPRLPAAAPRCLGFVADGPAHWLFLEDVGDTRLDPDDPRQRARAARLLGGLHAAAARLPLDERLPDWSARRFLGLLAESRAAIAAGLGNPALDAGGRARLADVIAVLTRLASCWRRIAAGCRASPPTLVHGDFRPKNLHVSHGPAGLVIRIIDWEYAGRGVAALDLGALLRDRCTRGDLEAYRDGLGRGAREESLERFAAAVHLGRVLRALVSMHWATTRLSSSALTRPVDDLCIFAAAMSAALAELEA